ncbi:MAG: methionyl-tRNA formyltransferase [Patescibacteria group bacterium]|nr:methionyl-tRNA formyltransferase [Patescibacteria group bacterium]MDD5295002.1 methionyl-tRNA formyltransferase [Patescibacteria group bacterium]MDD5554966.1 methionyl-tRNA formyltransferase [Patescibacteria group bacterium]
MSNRFPIKIIFAGTPDFAVPGFRALLADKDFKILSAITQPDKPVGRKQILTSPAIKTEAQKNNIPVWQPNKIADIKEKIREINPDLAVLIAYGQIIPQEILDIPRFGWINIHGSLLPRWRGAACVQAPILANDKKTGITIMKIEKGLDTGPILKQTEIKISPEETAETLHDKLSSLGAKILPGVIKDCVEGKIEPKPQNNSEASYAPTLKKEDGKIDWQKKAEEIERMARALNPWPGTWTNWQDKKSCLRRQVKIKKTESKILPINKYKLGQTFLHNNQLAVQCGQDALVIKTLQLEGKNEMTAQDFLRGYKEIVGQTLN